MADSLDSGSSAHSGRAGSSPASRTILIHRFCYKICEFFAFWADFVPKKFKNRSLRLKFSLIFSLIGKYAEALCVLYPRNILLHSVGSFPFHLVSYMRICVQSKGGRVVTEILLNAMQQQHSCALNHEILCPASRFLLLSF